MKKKLFISIPMSNRENTVKQRYNEALEIISNDAILKDYEIVPPYDIENFGDDGIINDIPEWQDTAFFMGKDVELVIRADAIFSCEGWSNSKGCRTERSVAEIYGLELYGFES